MDLISLFAAEFNIPVIEDEQKVWFFRTKAGRFYLDFRVNNFIGLGWEQVSPDLITDKKTDAEIKQIEANARLTDVQAEKEKAEAEKLRAEAKCNISGSFFGQL